MEATTGAAARPSTELDPAFAEQWAERFAAAWNELDASTIVSMVAEDVEWHDPVVPHPMRGHDDVRAFIAATAEAFPDFRFVRRGPLLVSPAEPVVAMRWRMSGTMTGAWSYSGLAATGESFEIVGVDEFTFRGELMWRCHSHFDRTEMARQLGAMPPVGSGAERTMIGIQNLKTRLRRRRA